jgi:hypothetical protein
VRLCSAWNGSRAFSNFFGPLHIISHKRRRKQTTNRGLSAGLRYTGGLAVSPSGVTSADERRRQIVVCPPVYAAGLSISPCGAGL